MVANKLEPHTVPISNQLIWSVSCASQSYKAILQATEKPKENDVFLNEKWTLLEEINAVSSKCVDLQNTSKTQDEEFIVGIYMLKRKIIWV